MVWWRTKKKGKVLTRGKGKGRVEGLVVDVSVEVLAVLLV